MKFDELPKDVQDEIQMIGHRSEIEVEDDKRRQCTRFGYRFGGTMGLFITMVAMVFITGFAIVGLAIAAPSLDTRMSTSPLFWLCFTPIALIPIVPFLFLKLRYALKGLVITVAIFLVVALLVGAGTKIEGFIMDTLL